MEGKDPTVSGASPRWGERGDLDEAPVFTTRQHLDYLVGLITNEWKKTTVVLKNASANVTGNNIYPAVGVLEYFDGNEDTVTRVDASTVPQVIISKVDDLRHIDRIGLPHLTNLMDLAKKELATNNPFALEEEEEEEAVEGGNGDKAANFADMLIELAKKCVYAEIVPKEETGLDLTVIFVDKSGEMKLRPCRLQHDTDFASFLVLMDKYPQEFDLNVTWAASFWDGKVRELEEKGYEGHPKLREIGQLIASFKARDYGAGSKWVFYKTNQRVAYAKPIGDEHDLKMILGILAKKNRLACMVRAVDKDIIRICDELSFFEKRLQDYAFPRELPATPHTQGDQGDPGDQKTNNAPTTSIDRFSDEDISSYDLTARTLGTLMGGNLAFLLDGDEQEAGEKDEAAANIVKN